MYSWISKQKPNEDLIHRWWTAMDLWYNFTDRYDAAMDRFIDATHDYVFTQQNARSNEESQSSHIYDCCDYGIDNLEIEWNRILNQVETDGTLQKPNEAIENTDNDVCGDDWNIAIIQLLLFVAGTCLDAANIITARRCLFHAILRLISRLAVHSSREESPLADGVYDASYTFKLLALTLQEYVTSYEEDHEREIPHWIVARRIATMRMSALTPGNTNPLMRGVTSTGEPQHCFWNPQSMYQRPPYYIHYPYFLRSPVALAKTLPLPVVPRESHPAWCSQLEQHIHTIQKEFEELILQNSSSSRNFESQYQYVDDDNYKSDCKMNNVPVHWPKVGAGDHRNGAGMHDSSVVHDGGDWRELVLFSANFTANAMDARNIAPQTKRLIRHFCSDEALSLVDTGIGEVIFSVLAPHTHILPHTASHNVRYTAHLPLRVPKHKSSGSSFSESPEKPACFIRVGDEIHTWTVGQMLVFDDSYEHEVVNSTEEIRGVLLIRFWHPLLANSDDRERAIQWVQKEQNEDRCRRFNPPVPPQVNGERVSFDQRGAVTARGMEQTLCSSCELTGYASIRCDLHQRQFVCICGSII